MIGFFDKSFYTIWLLISRGMGGWGKKCLLLSRRQTRRVTQLEWSWFIQAEQQLLLWWTPIIMLWNTQISPFLSDLLSILGHLLFALTMSPLTSGWIQSVETPSEAWWSEEWGHILIFWFLGFFLWVALISAPFYNFGLLCDLNGLGIRSCTSCIGSTES